jgi:hypothetical protein
MLDEPALTAMILYIFGILLFDKQTFYILGRQASYFNQPEGQKENKRGQRCFFPLFIFLSFASLL